MAVASGCGSDANNGADGGGASTSGGHDANSGGGGAGATASDAGGSGGFVPGTSEPPEPEVLAHSQTTLFRFDPIGKTLTTVGDFDCVSGGGNNMFGFGMADIAADSAGRLHGVGAIADGPPGVAPPQGLVEIDRDTGSCSLIAEIGTLVVTGLTWLPAGMLEPDDEVLVGIVRSQLTQTQYVRFDQDTGELTLVGDFGGSWFATSADIVSIEGDATYATAYPSFSPEHLLVIDPLTGSVVQDLGNLGLNGVTGLGYWGGLVYLFTHSGQLFEVDPHMGVTQPTEIPIPNAPFGLQFWGAGVGTNAPVELPK